MKKYGSMILTVIAASLMSCGKSNPGSEKSAPPICQYNLKSSDGQSLRWGPNFPITLFIHSSVPTKFRPALEEAINQWNLALNRNLFVLNSEIDSSPTTLVDGKNIIYWFPRWPENKNLPAHTLLHWQDSKIFEADMMINAENIAYSFNPKGSEYDIVSVVIHELGHILGLDHVDRKESVMASHLENAVKRREISALEKNTLQCLYGFK